MPQEHTSTQQQILSSSRWVFGIDLGTSHSSVVGTKISEGSDGRRELVELGPLPCFQIRAPRQIEKTHLISSAIYFPTQEEIKSGVFPDPFENLYQDNLEESSSRVIGDYARAERALRPERVIVSAKSWLSQQGIDNDTQLLPEVTRDSSGIKKISPVDATSIILMYLRRVILNFLAAQGEIEPAQSFYDSVIVITVPASFDEAARAATTRAAEQAGFVGSNILLLEEPMAAVYSWLNDHRLDWRDKFAPGDYLLVADVGGGTTDFSLLEIQDHEGSLGLERVRVGDHILLGGDNIDLALAHQVRQVLSNQGTLLDSWQFLTLQQLARDAKEKLLSEDAPAEISITIPSQGADLFASSVSFKLQRESVRQLVIEGFFPLVPRDSIPAKRNRVGLRESGLAYASDPAITKHLAAFLRSDSTGDFPKVSALLCNGGVFIPQSLQERIASLVAEWSRQPSPPLILPDSDLRLAVARGAAVFGGVKSGTDGFLIRARTARSYYIGIESVEPAIPGYEPPLHGVCIVPQGLEEGSECSLIGHNFFLYLDEANKFQLFSSTRYPHDKLGALHLDAERSLEKAGSVSTILTSMHGNHQFIPVTLTSRLTDVGVLELWLKSDIGEESWRLEWSTRSGDTVDSQITREGFTSEHSARVAVA